LFEAYDRDPAKVRRAMEGLKQSGSFEIEKKALEAISKQFKAGRVNENQVARTIRKVFKETGYLLDPHSAIGVFTAEKHQKSNAPMVTLATAHPAKFPLAVEKACGISPALPSWLAGLMQREERFEVLDADIKTVESFIAKHARIGN
jgi:threonine synthase